MTDVVVVGVGGIGSSVLAELGRREIEAVGIDRFAPPHDRGSSHGRTRLIRTAYFEHPDYVPLLHEAFDGWATLEGEAGLDLYTETGLLEVGPPDGVVVPGVLAAADQHRLAVDRLSVDDLRSEFPWFRFADDQVGVFERRAGVLRVEACIEAALDVARRVGVEIRTGEVVTGLDRDGAGWVVTTDQGMITARAVIVAAGAWAGRVLGGWLPLSVRRKSLFWFPTAEPRLASGPAFFFELAHGQFYGFPTDDVGLKVAEHTGGRTVDDPLAVDRGIDPVEQGRLVEFLGEHIPGVGAEVLDHQTCLYTMTPDEHFVVDRLPDGPGAVVAGLSGHGFKFAPVLGRALVDLATEGRTDLPVGFLGAGRFG